MELIVFPGYAKICNKNVSQILSKPAFSQANIVLPKQDLGRPPLPTRPLCTPLPTPPLYLSAI